jgi:galactose mutarotase-like enzyme
MCSIQTGLSLDGVPMVRLESDHLQVDVAPSVGGRVVSLVDKTSGHEWLWRNRALPLRRLSAGAEYDPNFFGGIDELLPNDPPEVIDGVSCPDHGELWTTALKWKCDQDRLRLWGKLPLIGLEYEREMVLRTDRPCLDFRYRISNRTARVRPFVWKLHAALAVAAGDVIECSARDARVVDLAWSRHKTLEPFPWPVIEGQAVHVVPPPDGTVDFFYLFDLAAGELALRRPGRKLQFVYRFDRGVFPYAWLFASYGGFDGHYTVILEPCTAMPMSVNAAAAQKQCSTLGPGETLETEVSIWAGPDEPVQILSSS